MTHVLVVATLKLGSPVVLVIGIKVDDLAFHLFRQNHARGRQVSTKEIWSGLLASRPRMRSLVE